MKHIFCLIAKNSTFSIKGILPSTSCDLLQLPSTLDDLPIHGLSPSPIPFLKRGLKQNFPKMGEGVIFHICNPFILSVWTPFVEEKIGVL